MGCSQASNAEASPPTRDPHDASQQPRASSPPRDVQQQPEDAHFAPAAEQDREQESGEVPLELTAVQLAAASHALEASEKLMKAASAAEASDSISESVSDSPFASEELWVQYGGEAVEGLLDDCALVDVHYLIQLADGGGIVPRCQELPEVARITRANVWRLRQAATRYFLPVLALSYCWLDATHPDALGETLALIKPVLMAIYDEVRCNAGQHATVGVMWDFISLPQRPRSEAEEERFSCGLRRINEWYRHPYITVLAVTNALPTGKPYTNTRLFSERGWCYFELHISSLTKHDKCLWDMNKLSHGAGFSSMRRDMKAKRPPPMSPDEFAEEMRKAVASGKLAFTAHADAEFVIEQYHKGFIAAFEEYTRVQKNGAWIHMTALGWGSEDGQVLARALSYAEDHCSFPETLNLVLKNNSFDGRALVSLKRAARKCFNLVGI
mmetsp:Transcript_120119/g.351042  ORF Transcript_120119/g.351042 Transcript_120119/m.351042 type:complete len:441 (+) Transcript_120119:95-1417(+)